METRKMKFNKDIQLNAKARNKNIIESSSERLIAYYSDFDKKNRKQEHLCRCCFYYFKERIGGSAITPVICANCDEKLTFSNTCVDILCDKCAEELNVCKHCGQRFD